MVSDVTWSVAGDAQVKRRFTRLETACDDFTAPLTAIMGIIEDETSHQFSAEGDPRWPALTKRYAARKRRRRGFATMLIASGALRASLVRRGVRGAIAEVTKTEMRRGSSLTVGKRRRWNLALIHYLGAPNVPREGGKGLPARPMLRLRRNAQSQIVGAFRRHLWERGELSSQYAP